jgi:hypothetical protein
MNNNIQRQTGGGNQQNGLTGAGNITNNNNPDESILN